MTSNYSDLDLINQLNDEVAGFLMPAIVYVGILTVLGVCGNGIVIVVFMSRLTYRLTQNYLILSLACIDLIVSVIAMPVEILDMQFYYTFPSVVVCKIGRFVNSLCVQTSVGLLLGISIDRFIKICRPLKQQWQRREARNVVVVSLCMALLCSSPSPFIYGLQRIETGVIGLKGKNCATTADDTFLLFYNGLMAAFFVVFGTSLIVMYAMIGLAIKRHRCIMLRTNSPIPNKMQLPKDSDEEEEEEEEEEEGEQTKRNKRAYYKLKSRTTLIGFTVTAVFVLSFMPYLFLIITSVFIDYRWEKDFIANILIRSYLFNCVSNPFIYGAMNMRFREACLDLLKRTFHY